MSALAFADPVFDSQAAFRRILRAISAPGTILPCGEALAPPASLVPAAAAGLLTLADFETPLWIAPSFGDEVAAYLLFRTGAPRALAASEAAFALVDLAADGLVLDTFALGTAEYPDRSTTIVAQGATLEKGAPLTLTGPGIRDHARLAAAPLPADFVEQWTANRARFPLGVDLILAAGALFAALPRSTILAKEQR